VLFSNVKNLILETIGIEDLKREYFWLTKAINEH